MQRENESKKDNVNSRRGEALNVLIIDGDPDTSRFMLEILARKGIRGHLVYNKDKAFDFINKENCGLVFINENFCKKTESDNKTGNGFELLEKIKTNCPELPVVMIADETPKESQDQRSVAEKAVMAIRQGCCDFLIKPLEHKKVESLLDTFLPNHCYFSIASEYDGPRCLYQIVGKSLKLTRIIDLAKKIAPTTTPVLISGESGTGKELIAYLIHHKSKRSQNSYIRINCAALSDSLLESELFGHEKGAFTGAYTQRKGRFEMAHGGTLLLDEITETPIRFQAKLLRVLEQQDFERVGGNESVRVDVRIISTTNKDLLNEVQIGRFRQDLYYRLSAIRLALCPLRERVDDLNDLVWYFVNLYSHEVQRQITELDPGMMEIFSKYDWPGNIRQLRNVVRTALILGAGPTLSIADVSWLFNELQPLQQQNFNNNLLCKSVTKFPEKHDQDDFGLGGLPLEDVERQAIFETLRQTGGNKTKAAKVLGISDRTLRDRIHRYRKEGCLQSV
jgi:DNA-binding NtrC family response regulator